MQEIKEKITALAKEWEIWRHDKIVTQHPKHKYEEVQVRFEKVWAKFVVDNSVDAFIALYDGENKKLGPYKAGDIFMPQSWNSPAKNKRGSLFSEKPMSCFGIYGVKRMDER